MTNLFMETLLEKIIAYVTLISNGTLQLYWPWQFISFLYGPSKIWLSLYVSQGFAYEFCFLW